MNLNRRNFVRSLGVGAAGALALPSLLAKSAKSAPLKLPAYDPQHDADFWRAVRAQYPLDPAITYFNTGGLGPAASPVLDVFTRSMMAHQRVSDTGHEDFSDSRPVLAQFFGVDAEELCFTRNATEGNCIIAGGLALQAGDEVIFESHAHPGGSLPWYNQHNRRGIVVKLFEPDPTSAEGNLARIRALLTPRTKVIQVSHVTAPTGIVLPVTAIAKLAHEHGAWFHIDGAQSAGMFPFSLRAIGCDSYATSGHKWLGAPHETGVFFIRRDRLDAVAPIATGANAGEIGPVLPGNFKNPASARRHEYGTRNAASIDALAEAVRFHAAVGHERITAHGRALAEQLHAGLAKISGVTVLTPTAPELRGSITTFRSGQMHYEKLFERLWKDHKLRCRPVSEQGLDAIRVSTHLFNTADDCERLLAAVADITRKA